MKRNLIAMIEEGMHTLKQSARRLVLEGTTALTELQAITVEDYDHVIQETPVVEEEA